MSRVTGWIKTKNKMKKNTILSFMAILFVALLSAACGNDTPDDTIKEQEYAAKIVGQWESTYMKGYLHSYDATNNKDIYTPVNKALTPADEDCTCLEFSQGGKGIQYMYDAKAGKWVVVNDTDDAYTWAVKGAQLFIYNSGKLLQTVKIVSLSADKLVIEETSDPKGEYITIFTYKRLK